MPARPCVSVGERYGKWTVVSLVGPQPGKKNQSLFWLCRCDCGTEREVGGPYLKLGRSLSCGCRYKKPKKHGMMGTPEYRSWASMRSRCRNLKDSSYARYGGKGVVVCARWDSFENFYADMGPRPAGTSIDRIDNTGNYEPSNCRWATNKEQHHNRSDNRYIEHDGRRLTISQWAEALNMNVITLGARLKKWPTERALTEPLHMEKARGVR